MFFSLSLFFRKKKKSLKQMLQKYVKKETLAKLDECAKYMSSPEYWEHAHSMDEYKKIVEGLFLLFFFKKKLNNRTNDILHLNV